MTLYLFREKEEKRKKERKSNIMLKCSCWNHRAVEEAGVAVVRRGRPEEEEAGQLGTRRLLKQGPTIDHRWPVVEEVVVVAEEEEEEATDRLEFRPTFRRLIWPLIKRLALSLTE